MRDIEKMLESARRTPPSSNLDRRIEQALSAAPVTEAWWAPATVWKAAAVLLLIAAAFAGGRWSARADRAPAEASRPTVFIIHGGGSVEAFDAPANRQKFLQSPDGVRIQIVQPETAEPGSI
jgi:hypothetical protein